jgi:anti-sigma B factor antagonist
VPPVPLERFSWSLAERDGEVVVEMRGDLDLDSEPEAREAIAAAEGAAGSAGSPMVVDLSAVTFVGSCGVRILLEAADRASSAGRELLLIRSPAADRVLELTGLADRFQYRSD